MSLTLTSLLSVALGGALGATIRLITVVWMTSLLGPTFPWGTLAVNVVGSFLMGVAVKSFLIWDISSTDLRLFLTTGILGGFTTFSAFSLDVVQLVQRSAYGSASAYIIASVGVSIFALVLGFLVVDMVQAWSQ